MPFSEKELAILIKIKSELAEGRDAQALLAQLNAEAEITAAGMGKMGEASEEAGKEVEFLGLKGHEAHMAMRLLGGQLGEAGHLLHHIFSPELLGITGMIIAVKMLREQFEAMGEQVEKNLEWNRRLKEIILQSSEEVARASKQETAAYNIKVQHQFDGEDRLKKAVEERLRLYGLEQDHMKSIIDLEAGRFNAYIDFMVKIGKLTPQEGDEAKAKEKRFVENQKERSEQLKIKNEMDENEKLSTKYYNVKKGDEADLPEARAAAAEADRNARSNKLRQEDAHKIFEDKDAAAKEAEKRAAEFEDAYRKSSKHYPGLSNGQHLEYGLKVIAMTTEMAAHGETPVSIAEDAKKKRADAESARGVSQSLLDHQVDLDTATKGAAAKVSQLEEESSKMLQSMRDLDDQTKKLADTLKQRQQDYAGTIRAENRDNAASAYYAHPPTDAESQQLFNMGAGDSGLLLNAVKKVYAEANKVASDGRAGIKNPAAIAAALDHIHSILASNADLGDQTTTRLENAEKNLQTLRATVQRQLNTNPNH